MHYPSLLTINYTDCHGTGGIPNAISLSVITLP